MMFNSDQYLQETLARIDFDNLHKHPNILIAARFWEEDRFQAARSCYRFMRTIDDLIDDRKTREETLSCMEKKVMAEQVNDWIGCLKSFDGDDPFILEIIETISRFKIPLEYFHNFARSMLYDIEHNGFATYEDFISYAEGASNGPASIFVHLCCLGRVNGSYIEPSFNIADLARPCAIFSYLVHIIRDFHKDQSENLNYFAKDILSQNNLTYDDLKRIASMGTIPDQFRNMIRFYYDKADEYRCETTKVLKTLKNRIEPKYYLSLRIIFDLYLQVFERIDVEHGTFSPEELTPTPGEIKERLERFVYEKEPACV